VASLDTFGARSSLRVADASYEIFDIGKVPGHDRLPFSLKILLENLLRTEDGANITADTSARWRLGPEAEPSVEIQFTPARVLMQDFTGVPCVVDLATMREAVVALGGDAGAGQPARPGRAGHRPLGHRRRLRPPGRLRCATWNSSTAAIKERYQFLRWGQTAFERIQGRSAGYRESCTR
jgi:aconitate hydratase